MTDRVSLGEWKSRLQEIADRENDLELGVLVRSLDSIEGYLADTSKYDVTEFSKALAAIGMAIPTVDVDYVTRFLRE